MAPHEVDPAAVEAGVRQWQKIAGWDPDEPLDEDLDSIESMRRDMAEFLTAAYPLLVADKDAEVERLREHILDIDAHATPFGDIPDDPGYVGTYLVTAGSLHRALGKIGHTAPSCEAEVKVAKVKALADRNRGGGPCIASWQLDAALSTAKEASEQPTAHNQGQCSLCGKRHEREDFL